jgi:hypothetical protein
MLRRSSRANYKNTFLILEFIFNYIKCLMMSAFSFPSYPANAINFSYALEFSQLNPPNHEIEI